MLLAPVHGFLDIFASLFFNKVLIYHIKHLYCRFQVFKEAFLREHFTHHSKEGIIRYEGSSNYHLIVVYTIIELNRDIFLVFKSLKTDTHLSDHIGVVSCDLRILDLVRAFTEIWTKELVYVVNGCIPDQFELYRSVFGSRYLNVSRFYLHI